MDGGYNIYGGVGNTGGNVIGTVTVHNKIGPNGTGGLLNIYTNDITNLGKITANGVSSAKDGLAGGASGGGSINIFYKNQYQNFGELKVDGGIGYRSSLINEGDWVGAKAGNGGTGSISVGQILNGIYTSTYTNY